MNQLEHKPEIDRLIAQLGSKRATERDAASEHLSALGPEAVEAVLEALLRDNATYQARKRNMARDIYIHMVPVVGVTLAMATIWPESPALAFFLIATFCNLIGNGLAYSSKRKRTLRALAFFSDPRVMAPLIRSFVWNDTSVSPISAAALTKLLPRLTDAESTLLDGADRAGLYRLLTRDKVNKFPDLIISILSTLETLGDEKSIKPVKALIDDWYTPANIRRVAKEILPAIRQRAESARTAATLLRPADAPPDDRLLRPASGPGDVVEALLLRPVGGDE